jgi:hypothetical protein
VTTREKLSAKTEMLNAGLRSNLSYMKGIHNLKLSEEGFERYRPVFDKHAGDGGNLGSVRLMR